MSDVATVRGLGRLDVPKVPKAVFELMLQKIEELKAESWGRLLSRGLGMLHCDGWGASVIAEVECPGGSIAVHEVSASWRLDRVEVRVARTSWHNNEWYWDEQLTDRSNAVVIDGKHYRINPDLPVAQRDMAGCAGREFRIRWHDGREVTTRNLWVQGRIPDAYRDRLPDEAVFVNKPACAGERSES